MRKLIDSFRRSFSARLSLWVVSFAALVFLAAMSYIFFVSRRYVREEAILRATQVVENSVLRLNSILEGTASWRMWKSPPTTWNGWSTAIWMNPSR